MTNVGNWLLTILQFWLFDKLLKATVSSGKNYDELNNRLYIICY
jgi:hypothetical protein